MDKELLLELGRLYQFNQLTTEKANELTSLLEIKAYIDSFTKLQFSTFDGAVIETFNTSQKEKFTHSQEDCVKKMFYLIEVKKVPVIAVETAIILCNKIPTEFAFEFEYLNEEKGYQFFDKMYSQYKAEKTGFAAMVQGMTNMEELVEQKDFLQNFISQSKEMFGTKEEVEKK